MISGLAASPALDPLIFAIIEGSHWGLFIGRNITVLGLQLRLNVMLASHLHAPRIGAYVAPALADANNKKWQQQVCSLFARHFGASPLGAQYSRANKCEGVGEDAGTGAEDRYECGEGCVLDALFGVILRTTVCSCGVPVPVP
jgi:hypothetical protein